MIAYKPCLADVLLLTERNILCAAVCRGVHWQRRLFVHRRPSQIAKDSVDDCHQKALHRHRQVNLACKCITLRATADLRKCVAQLHEKTAFEKGL